MVCIDVRFKTSEPPTTQDLEALTVIYCRTADRALRPHDCGQVRAYLSNGGGKLFRAVNEVAIGITGVPGISILYTRTPHGLQIKSRGYAIPPASALKENIEKYFGERASDVRSR
jgi:hypothetical protein